MVDIRESSVANPSLKLGSGAGIPSIIGRGLDAETNPLGDGTVRFHRAIVGVILHVKVLKLDPATGLDEAGGPQRLSHARSR